MFGKVFNLARLGSRMEYGATISVVVTNIKVVRLLLLRFILWVREDFLL